MLDFLFWYLTVSLLGLLTFPLVYRLLPALPDRGYTLSRAFALLLWGYIFWLLASLGMLRNDLGGLILALAVILGLSLWAFKGIEHHELSEWWHAHRSLVLSVEILFLLAFAGWALVRAANPDIVGTEKPMELAFINAILSSPAFPPHDPWLSGYAISYYYFGYLMAAMLARLTVTAGSVAFNLSVALVFALSASSIYGLVYNLLSIRISGRDDVLGRKLNLAGVGVLGPILVLLVSNVEGFLEVLHARGLFWRQAADGLFTSSFWTWLDIKDLGDAPASPFSWIPDRYLWWWRASRVLQDYDLSGAWKEIIDEFPFFSFLLGDLHPHVLAMPFAFLALGIILNLFMGGARGSFSWFGIRLNINTSAFVTAAIVLGGLAFLNTWDFPIYVGLFCGAQVLRMMLFGRGLLQLMKEFFKLVLALGISGILLYMPFYLGFSSQAGGILPNLIYPTRGAHLWVMFGQFLIPIFAYLVYLYRQSGNGHRLLKGAAIVLGLSLLLWVAALALGKVIASLPVIGEIFLASMGAIARQAELFQQAILRRVANLGSWVTLAVLLSFPVSLLLPEGRTQREMRLAGEPRMVSKPASLWTADVFVLLLILAGGLLVLFPEFFFLRDQFGWRMNTIFKFYYQAWLLLGLAAAYAVILLIRYLRGGWAVLFIIGIGLTLAVGLAYPALSLWEKTSGFHPPAGLTLDGAAFLERQTPDEMAAIRWLRSAPSGIVLEAVGDSYSDYARVATFSGDPTVLGWPGHESQWRGGGLEMGSRESDVERMYRSGDWMEVEALLKSYNIRYVYIGSLERIKYRVNEVKFKQFLSQVYQGGQVTIYEIP